MIGHVAVSVLLACCLAAWVRLRSVGCGRALGVALAGLALRPVGYPPWSIYPHRRLVCPSCSPRPTLSCLFFPRLVRIACMHSSANCIRPHEIIIRVVRRQNFARNTISASRPSRTFTPCLPITATGHRDVSALALRAARCMLHVAAFPCPVSFPNPILARDGRRDQTWVVPRGRDRDATCRSGSNVSAGSGGMPEGWRVKGTRAEESM